MTSRGVPRTPIRRAASLKAFAQLPSTSGTARRASRPTLSIPTPSRNDSSSATIAQTANAKRPTEMGGKDDRDGASVCAASTLGADNACHGRMDAERERRNPAHDWQDKHADDHREPHEMADRGRGAVQQPARAPAEDEHERRLRDQQSDGADR